ncbi:hypothetical protein BH23GEM3_BH23GEM3_11160 [soil metagenome]|nr:response regulator [Gemmatimonadota bacterium]
MAAQRILLIEDEPCARDALGSLLADEGYTVCTAGTGLAGLEMLKEFHPDTVVCDFLLPDINGLEVLRQARTLVQESVTFIIVTAGGSREDVENALRREADLFIEKPINLARFRHALKHILPPSMRSPPSRSTLHGKGAANGRA